MQDICSLMDVSDVMDALADELVRVARPGRGSPRQCHDLLRRLERHLAAHRTAQARFRVADAALAPADPFEAELRALHADFAVLAESWAPYLGRWTQNAIAEDRAAFSQETGDMMTAFKLRIARESEVTYPLALETGRLCLRVAG